MTICKVKNPVEFSFTIWMNNFPASGHPLDKERFFVFVRTVHRHNATKWKNPNYLRQRILKGSPKFDPEYLEYLLRLYHELLNYSKAYPKYSNWMITSEEVKEGNYIEKWAKDGKIYSRELPFRR